MDRREFLKTAGAGAIALGLASCTNNKGKSQEKGAESMAHHLGTDVSLLGYGCMRWPKINREDGSMVIDQDRVDELVAYAMEHGINYFDSSPIYLKGLSEEATAKALSKFPRESYYIATKLSSQKGAWSFEDSKAMYRRSLEIYSTDYIDYYLLHNIGSIADYKKRFIDNGIIDYLLEERRLGHIRHLGFSLHADEATFDYMMQEHSKYHWDFVQIQMNYLDWNHAGEEDTNASYMYPKLDELGIPVVIMEPLRGGALADVPSEAADKLKAIEPSRSIASWAFRFCGSFPRILTVLSGMTYMEHLQDNLDTYLDFKSLSEEEFDLLEKTAQTIDSYPIVGCTECAYCMPCPYGIDIPGIFSFYNRHINDGSYVSSTEQKNYRKLKTKYLLDYEKSIESVRQADHCIGCGKCLPKCPQHIDIPSKLHSIDGYLEKLKQGKVL